MRERLLIATISENAESLAGEYEIGVEFDHFCMAQNMDLPNLSKVQKEIQSIRCNCHGRRPLILHGPFNELFPAAIDPKARQLAADRYEQAYSLAMKYNINKMVLHSGYVPFVYFKEWHHAQSVAFWSTFMKEKDPDFTLYIENVLEDEPDMLMNIIKEIDNKQVKICLDTGHAHRMSQVPVTEWIKKMGSLIGHIHLHNNDRKYDSHNPIFEGTMDIRETLQAIQQYCTQYTTITLECLTSASSLEWLEKEGFLK